MLYIGLFHDEHEEVRLDIPSISNKMYKTVNKFYSDMVNYGITNGSNIDQFTDNKLDELNQLKCDILTLNSSNIEKLKNKII